MWLFVSGEPGGDPDFGVLDIIVDCITGLLVLAIAIGFVICGRVLEMGAVMGINAWICAVSCDISVSRSFTKISRAER